MSMPLDFGQSYSGKIPISFTEVFIRPSNLESECSGLSGARGTHFSLAIIVLHLFQEKYAK